MRKKCLGLENGFISSRSPSPLQPLPGRAAAQLGGRLRGAGNGALERAQGAEGWVAGGALRPVGSGERAPGSGAWPGRGAPRAPFRRRAQPSWGARGQRRGGAPVPRSTPGPSLPWRPEAPPLPAGWFVRGGAWPRPRWWALRPSWRRGARELRGAGPREGRGGQWGKRGAEPGSGVGE